MPTKRAAPRPRVTLRTYFRYTNLLTSLILVFPLYLLYQLGVVVLPGIGNGADFLTGRLIALAGHSRALYLLLNLGLAAAFLLLVFILRRRQQFDPRLFVPVLIESGIYALTMGSLILYVMALLGIRPTLDVGAEPAFSGGPLVRVILAIGAGVNEELLFRLLLLPGAVVLLEKVVGLSRALAIACAFLVTAFIFSAAHHVVGGEPWRFGVFTYRFLCGLFFAALYQWRSFAVAVYTHTLYDIYVMLLHP